jgi:hypothetical protein
MSQLAVISQRLPAMSSDELMDVRRLEAEILELDQVEITTHHQIHGGIYTRTICIPKGVAMTGALLKVATTLTISGDLTVYTGAEAIRFTGFTVFPGSAGRKQAVYAHEDTWASMSFPTKATSVDEAEKEFTDEWEKLGSKNSSSDQLVITGE